MTKTSGVFGGGALIGFVKRRFESMRRKPTATGLLGLLILSNCSTAPELAIGSPSGIPRELADGWRVGVPEAAGLDRASLGRLSRDLETGEYPNTHALLIEYDGTLVFERYFSGTDERWGEPLGETRFDPDSLHDLRPGKVDGI